MKTIDFLNKEKENLEQKISNKLENGDIGTYKNLITAYKEILRLIKDEDVWQEKFSHYITDDNEMISTWEQKGEDIRNEKKYEVKEVVDNKNKIKLYYDLNVAKEGMWDCDLYHNDKIIRLKNISIKYICERIANIGNKDNMMIYCDNRGIARVLYDSLIEKEYSVICVKTEYFDTKKIYNNI